MSTVFPSSTFRPTSIRCSNDRQALFNRIAPVYDNLNDLLSLGQHRIWKRMAVSWTQAKMGDRVLDVCCGSADFIPHSSLHLSLQSPKSNLPLEELAAGVIGLDFSKEQLMVASSRSFTKNCFKNIEWVEGDALDLPFADNYFDAITMGYGLRNVVDKRKAMQEILRVLKPGSNVSILDFNKSNELLTSSITEWMIDNIVVPVASVYGLSDDYRYLKRSIREFLTGKELEKLALDVGFSTARHYEIGGGLMGCLVAKN
ncbi:hypothetical protein TSUD_221500 [Trifolium subterraneum]|uniref:2-phytyl-1,4-beta-naphthoquinone methyltransferase, chloroplastic n=1 Tax=Trifolium subterraneum TaxID=3900 RepID=A0A2Z6MVH2_TRISU|nr:hypothetical protein TSUD_221500 [Trifolium subterraneum]